MGYQIIIDIIGSAVMAGVLLMTLLNMKEANTANTFKYAGNQIVQQNLIALTEILDNDFKQIGYRRDNSTSGNPIIIATRNRIKFKTDIKPNSTDVPDGTEDQIEYYFSGVDTGTLNPSDTLLTRTVTTSDARFNQTGAVTNLQCGIVGFTFRYKDEAGNDLPSTPPDPNLIRSIQVYIQIQSTSTYKNTQYSASDKRQFSQETATWQRTYYRDKSRTR